MIVVMTNGCFDLLHAGHVDCLRWARAQGDMLVVAVNSDESIRRIKGPGRPIIPLSDRVTMLKALRCVDTVVPFDDDTPIAEIIAVRPDLLVKGPDYQADEIAGAAAVRSWGGRVLTMPARLRPVSTTDIIRRIKETP